MNVWVEAAKQVREEDKASAKSAPFCFHLCWTGLDFGWTLLSTGSALIKGCLKQRVTALLKL